ncbi:MAG TPA: thermonuclease family protein [Gaiellales bacterium]|jgi:micrococcal nuclease
MHRRDLLIFILALAAVGVTAWWTTSSSAAQPFTRGTVVRAIDGDTILVQGAGGRVEDIRLLGIDTPETVDPRKPVQCYGPEASAFMKHLVTGRAVTLRYDRELHDRYGRFLAYVWLSGTRPLFVNAELVRRGFARTYPFPPNTAHADLFAALERSAAVAGRGLWHACG